MALDCLLRGGSISAGACQGFDRPGALLAKYAMLEAPLKRPDTGKPASYPLPGTVVDDGALAEQIQKAWMTCQEAVRTSDKARLRSLHVQAKTHDREVSYADLRRLYTRHRRYFPQPTAIDPSRIDPVLVPVIQRTLEGDLFRIARGYWSMPFSKGYGRRLRFLVMDRHHESVIGILGLQSPSADLACRDTYLGVDKDRKLAVVNNTLDAYTVGAMPAYASILGGKLVAGLLCSNKIRQAYWRAYGNSVTTQLKEKVPQPLIAITTASAFGRSSIYNRLRFKDTLLAEPIGYTKGYGTIHLERLYPLMADWLKMTGQHVPAGFGNGPKVRWQNIMRTLLGLGVARDCLAHGIQRQVFILPLVRNLADVCQNAAIADPIDFDDEAWTQYWLERWCGPRVLRNPEWKAVDSHALFEQALSHGTPD